MKGGEIFHPISPAPPRGKRGDIRPRAPADCSLLSAPLKETETEVEFRCKDVPQTEAAQAGSRGSRVHQ